MLKLIIVLVFGLMDVSFGQEVFAQASSSQFMQKIQGFKQGQIPPTGFMQSLERHDNQKFARAICQHAGLPAADCVNNAKLSVGWAVCIVSGNSREECNLPKLASLGFGICMAARRDSTDCNYVQRSSAGFGICMAAGRSFHECMGPSLPSLAFGYCMAGSKDISHCLNLDALNDKNKLVNN